MHLRHTLARFFSFGVHSRSCASGIQDATVDRSHVSLTFQLVRCKAALLFIASQVVPKKQKKNINRLPRGAGCAPKIAQVAQIPNSALARAARICFFSEMFGPLQKNKNQAYEPVLRFRGFICVWRTSDRQPARRNLTSMRFQDALRHFGEFCHICIVDDREYAAQPLRSHLYVIGRKEISRQWFGARNISKINKYVSFATSPLLNTCC